MIEAKIICDSISQEGIRLTTFQLRYPKFIHSEFMTHRVFSRNASSSRAIPTIKLINEAHHAHTRAQPVYWGKNQKGMQATEELQGHELSEAYQCWEEAAAAATYWAERMYNAGAHKQIVNRILEPFLHINVLVTATEYMNFFGLRLDKGAQPEIRALAQAMWKEYHGVSETFLTTVGVGEWHLPYIDFEDRENMATLSNIMTHEVSALDLLIKLSVARCARVSYKSFDTGQKPQFEEDIDLYNRLVGSHPIHASPAEHQATPDTNVGNIVDGDRWMHKDQWGNFKGWRQYRKMLPNESMAELPEEYRV